MTPQAVLFFLRKDSKDSGWIVIQINGLKMPMPRRMMLLGMCYILLMGSVDCSNFHPSPSLLPPPPSENVRATLGTIGVISAGPILVTELDLPPEGAGQGVLKGAKAGAEWGALGGLVLLYTAVVVFPPLVLLAIPAIIPVIVVGAIVGAIPGSIYGVISTAPAGAGRPADVILKEAIDNLKIEKTLRDRVFQVAHAQTDNRLILMQDQRPPDMGEDAFFHSFAEKGMTTILNIRIASVKLKEVGLGFNPPVRLSMTVWASLVSTNDNAIISAAVLIYRDSAHPLADWTANDAQRFREEVDAGLQSVADQIVDQLFLVYPLPPGG